MTDEINDVDHGQTDTDAVSSGLDAVIANADASETKPETSEAEQTQEPVQNEGETQQLEQPNQPEQPQSDLDKIQPPEKISEQGLRGWKALKSTAEQYKVKATQLEQEVARLNQERETIQSQSLSPEIQQELDNLRRLQYMQHVDQDPTFVEKYVKPSEAKSNEIYNLLKKNGASEDHIKSLTEADAVRNYDNKWWQETILAPLMSGPNSSAETRKAAVVIEQRLKEVLTLDYEKDQAIEQAKGNWQTYQQQQTEQQQQAVQREQQDVNGFVSNIANEVPWAKIQEIPKGATPEQRAEIEQSNKFFKEIAEPVFIEAYHANTPLQRAQLAGIAVLAQRQVMELQCAYGTIQQKDAMIKQLQGKIDGIKSASKIPRTTGRVNSDTPKVGVNTDDRSAISAGLDAIGAF